jgi:hypothetical protein
MPEALRDATNEILRRLEEESGCPVQVTAMGGLSALATIRIARANATAHYVIYNPLAPSEPDYLIAHACGVALRLFAVPTESRLEVAPAETGREAVDRELAAPGGVVDRFRLSPSQAASLRDKLYGGLMLQLRTTPVGLRVDRWLWETCPSLRDLQTAGARALLAEGVALLAPDVRDVTPARALAASLAMHGAAAEFWSRTWDEPGVLEPYRQAALDRDGRALMHHWDMLPDDPARDRALIDTWADQLGMADWYEWRPYPSPGDPAPAA